MWFVNNYVIMLMVGVTFPDFTALPQRVNLLCMPQ